MTASDHSCLNDTCLSDACHQAPELDQLSSLRRLIAALMPANRFYSQRLALAGLDKGPASLAHFASAMPLTTKQQLVEDQANYPPFGSNLSYPPDQYTRLSKTSGTGGQAIRWLDTAQSWSWMLDNWARVYQAAAVAASDRLYFAFSFGPHLGFWTAFESAMRLGCLCISGGGASSIARLHEIVDNAATVLCCTPSYALHLAEVAKREGLCLSRSSVRLLIVAGEPGGSVPAFRERISSAWNGAFVFDHHGMTEVGPVSYQCPKQPGVLHVIRSSYLAEVIDPADSSPYGRVLAPGESGELVLTTLGRFGSPLLRYRTGDRVRLGVARCCVCGTTDPSLIGGVLDRVDGMVIIRGVNLHPAAVEQGIRAMAGIVEYRVIVAKIAGLSELLVEIEPDPGHPDPLALAARLESWLRLTFSLRIPVRLVESGVLPRFSMKAARWVFQEPNHPF